MFAAELELAFDHRRDHDDAADDNALIVLQRACHLGGAEAAIAFAQDVFRRADAAVLGDVKRDRLGERFGVAMHAPERAAAVGLGGATPAGADRIDHHQIGESEPGVRIVDQADIGAVKAVAESGDARTDQAEIEERGAGARTAVEHERYGAGRVVRFGDEGRVENRGRAFAGLIEQGECAGGRRVSELARRRVDRVLGDRIGRQKRKDARSAATLLALVAVSLAVAPCVRPLCSWAVAADGHKRDPGGNRDNGEYRSWLMIPVKRLCRLLL